MTTPNRIPRPTPNQTTRPTTITARRRTASPTARPTLRIPSRTPKPIHRIPANPITARKATTPRNRNSRTTSRRIRTVRTRASRTRTSRTAANQTKTRTIRAKIARIKATPPPAAGSGTPACPRRRPMPPRQRPSAAGPARIGTHWSGSGTMSQAGCGTPRIHPPAHTAFLRHCHRIRWAPDTGTTPPSELTGA